MTFKLTPKGEEIVGERGQDEGRKLRSGSLGAVARGARHLAEPGKGPRRALLLPPLTSSASQGEPPEPAKRRLRPSWSTSCEVLGETPTQVGAQGRGARRGLNRKTPRLLTSAVRRAGFGCRAAHHPSCSKGIEDTRRTAPPQLRPWPRPAPLPAAQGIWPRPFRPRPHLRAKDLPQAPPAAFPSGALLSVLWRPRPVPRSPAPKGAVAASEPQGAGRGGALGPTPPTAPARLPRV